MISTTYQTIGRPIFKFCPVNITGLLYSVCTGQDKKPPVFLIFPGLQLHNWNYRAVFYLILPTAVAGATAAK